MFFFPVTILSSFLQKEYVYIPLIFTCCCQKLASASKYILVRCNVRRIERFAAYFRKRGVRVSHNVHRTVKDFAATFFVPLLLDYICFFSPLPSGKFHGGLACVRLVAFVRPLSGSVSKQASRLIKICDVYVYVKKELLREGLKNHDDAV